MLPNLGQGACQAIEDAAALADSLGEATGPGDAVRAYSERRSRRAALVVKQSAQLSRIAHLGAAAALLRNAALSATPPSAAIRRLEPILGGDP
jgi:salicylate hydroxylase